MKVLEKPTVRGETDQGLLSEFATDEGSLDSALQILLDQDKEIDELEARLKNATQARAIAEQSVISKMLEQGVENFKALGKTVTRTERVFPSVLKEHKDLQMEWLQEVGMGALITPTVNSNTFGAFIRNTFIDPKLEAQLPSWIKIYREPKLLIRAVSR